MSSLKKSSAATKSSSSRGGAQRAELTEEQKQEIKEAFDLFDTGTQHTATLRRNKQATVAASARQATIDCN